MLFSIFVLSVVTAFAQDIVAVLEDILDDMRTDD